VAGDLHDFSRGHACLNHATCAGVPKVVEVQIFDASFTARRLEAMFDVIPDYDASRSGRLHGLTQLADTPKL
jgi:hypothetical protein